MTRTHNRHETSPTYAQADLGVQTLLVACGSIIGRMPATTLYTLGNTSWRTGWATRWVPAEWVDKARRRVDRRHRNSPAVRLAYQTAAERPSEPDAWTAMMWARFGVQYVPR